MDLIEKIIASDKSFVCMKIPSMILRTLIFSFGFAVSLAAGYVPPPYSLGHSVLVSRIPEESTEWKFALAKEAKQSIEWATGFTGGETFAKIALCLRDRMLAQPELRVHLVIASTCFLLPANAEKVLAAIKMQFPDRFYYQVTSMRLSFAKGHWQTRENHVKLLVVDGKYAVVGGTNLYDTYCKSQVDDASILYFEPVQQFVPRACLDMDVCYMGPLVQPARELFFELWREHDQGSDGGGSFSLVAEPVAVLDAIDSHPRLDTDVAMRMVSSGPGLRFGECTRLHAMAIKNARRSLDVMHMYTHPHRKIQRAVEGALDREVHMRLVTNGNGQTNLSLVPRVFGFFNRSTFRPLVGEGRGVEIYECNTNDVLYHKKVLVVDGRYTLIGSYNLGKKSHYGDFEVVLDIDSPEVASQFLQAMEADIACSQQCSPSEVHTWADSLWYRTMNTLQRWLLVGPLF